MTFVDMLGASTTSDGMPMELKIALLAVSVGLYVERLIVGLLGGFDEDS